MKSKTPLCLRLIISSEAIDDKSIHFSTHVIKHRCPSFHRYALENGEHGESDVVKADDSKLGADPEIFLAHRDVLGTLVTPVGELTWIGKARSRFFFVGFEV